MPLILPNTIANEQDADGNKLQQNFATIQDWANQDAISSDGSTAMIAPLLLPGVPTQPNQAATKSYVDTSVPVGVMQMFLGDTAPTNWMLCRAQAISRATYAALFAVIGTTYGAGDGTSTFNLPSMAGRSPMGMYPSGGWATALGQLLGNPDSSLPSHTHVAADHLHGVNLNTGTESAFHQHGPGSGASFATYTSGGGLGKTQAGPPNDFLLSGATANENALHYHNVNGSTGAADRGLVTTAAGVAPTNTNLAPVTVVNFIVKVL